MQVKACSLFKHIILLLDWVLVPKTLGFSILAIKCYISRKLCKGDTEWQQSNGAEKTDCKLFVNIEIHTPYRHVQAF